jgi:hypothetical protein
MSTKGADVGHPLSPASASQHFYLRTPGPHSSWPGPEEFKGASGPKNARLLESTVEAQKVSKDHAKPELGPLSALKEGRAVFFREIC